MESGTMTANPEAQAADPYAATTLSVQCVPENAEASTVALEINVSPPLFPMTGCPRVREPTVCVTVPVPTPVVQFPAQGRAMQVLSDCPGTLKYCDPRVEEMTSESRYAFAGFPE